MRYGLWSSNFSILNSLIYCWILRFGTLWNFYLHSLSFSSDNNLKFCTCSYSSCFYLKMRYTYIHTYIHPHTHTHYIHTYIKFAKWSCHNLVLYYKWNDTLGARGFLREEPRSKEREVRKCESHYHATIARCHENQLTSNQITTHLSVNKSQSE